MRNHPVICLSPSGLLYFTISKSLHFPADVIILFFFHGGLLFHLCILLYFHRPFICWWTSMLIFLCYCEQNHSRHGCANISVVRYKVLWIYLSRSEIEGSCVSSIFYLEKHQQNGGSRYKSAQPQPLDLWPKCQNILIKKGQLLW